MRARLRDPETVHRLRWITLLVLCVSLIVITLDNTILNVALPTLAHSKAKGGLGASESSLQWFVDSYTLVFAGLLLTAGSLGDKFGRYKALAFGLVVFGLGSGLAAFSSSPHMLIGFRSLMGVGGAFIMPSTLSILTNVFTDPIERGRAIGVWAGVSALGIGVGPVIGGALLNHFWWGSVLLVNVPIVAIGLIAGYLFIPSSKDPTSPKLDPLGAILSIAGLGAILWAVIEGPTRGWTSTGVLAGFVIGAVVLAGFLWWELTYDSPMLNLNFFRNMRFSAASGAITLTFMAMFGVVFLLTQYLQSVLEYSPLKAGALLLPMSAVLMVLAPLSARLVEFVGTKVVVTTGMLLVAGGFLLMTLLNPSSSEWDVVLVMLPFAAGMANVIAPATESIMGSLPREKAGVGSAINDTTRQVGGAVGVALLGSLLSSRYLSHVHDAFAGTPAPARLVDGVASNIQAAVAIGHSNQVPPQFHSVVLDTAKNAYVSGLHLALMVGAAILVVAAIGTVLWLPARGKEHEPMRIEEAGAQAPEATPVGAGAALAAGSDGAASGNGRAHESAATGAAPAGDH